jgi:hypothetical protein
MKRRPWVKLIRKSEGSNEWLNTIHELTAGLGGRARRGVVRATVLSVVPMVCLSMVWLVGGVGWCCRFCCKVSKRKKGGEGK